jgi:cytochrome P450
LTGRAKTGTAITTERADLASDIQRFAASHEAFKPQWEATTIIHIIAAGFDTLGMTLAACVTHLSQSPVSQAKLLAELDDARDNGALDDAPTYDQAAALPYLQACITEAMRLTSVIGVSLPRVVPSIGAVIEGHKLPGGTIVGINPWVVHRDKAMFGDDADEFRPERYSEASKARRFELEAHSLAFGGASRSCPGQSLARVALLKSVATMFLHFTFEVLDKEEALNYRTKREECFFVVKWYDVWVRLRRRRD